MRLSKRLEMVASFVEEGSRIADVGTDHGFVPIALAERRLIRHGLAMDIREGPLAKAREHIRAHGLEGVLETRLSDGVQKLKAGEADTVIMAGMGGQMMLHILEDGKGLWGQVGHWILSPQSHIEKVREYLAGHGFAIRREEMLKEDGKYYTVMEASQGSMEPFLPWESLYGPLLIQRGHPVLMEFLEQEKASLRRILEELSLETGERARERAGQLRLRLEWADEAQKAGMRGENKTWERREAGNDG